LNTLFEHNSALLFFRYSQLQTLFLIQNHISAAVLKDVELELVLCQLRAQVTEIDASGKDFDDADATRMAEALCGCAYT